ncbi:MAG TPA: ATP-binding cassette domain-containing protein [Thermoanaerobaculia bacterium]|nr:ATP-binding cassette domain-containing protein [Thermoanaerobaculia bacterium]
MIELAIEGVAYRRGRLDVEGLSVAFPRSTHTSLAGPPGGGKSSILHLLEGSLRPRRGRIVAGTRDITHTRPAARPFVHSASTAVSPSRWSVRHALVAAARTRRGLDFEDRIAEVRRLAEEWGLTPLLDARLREISTHERLRARLVQLLLIRPAVLLAERPFALIGTATGDEDRFWRMLRADGCTIVHEISRPEEIGWADRVVLVEGGAAVDAGNPRQALADPPTAALGAALAEASSIPIEISGTTVRSPIGEWTADPPPFQGSGTALARPWSFEIAPPDEESDFLFGIEEARFLGPRWELTGIVTGGGLLRIWVAADERPTKGRLLPIRFDPSSLRLYPGGAPLSLGAPLDVVPSRRDSR